MSDLNKRLTSRHCLHMKCCSGRLCEISSAAHIKKLLRNSGTESVCRVMVEGPSDDLVKRLANRVADVVKKELA